MYYTLFTREPDGLWSPQFGDYDRAIVAAEEHDSYAASYRRRDRRVVATVTAHQRFVDEARDRLNAGGSV